MRKKMGMFKKVSVFIMVMGVLLCQLSVFAQNGPVITANPSGPVCVGDQVTLSVSCPDDGTLIFSEGFSCITNGNDGANGSSSYYGQNGTCLANSFPIYSDMHVWQAGGHLRFGEVSEGYGNSGCGFITSIPMDLSLGLFTVKLWVRGWNNQNEHPYFYLLVDADTVLQHNLSPRPFDAPYELVTYTSTTVATSHSTITIGNSDIHQRFFLDSVAVEYVTPIQYLWSTGETTSTITVTPDQAGNPTYTVTVSNSSACSGTDNITLDVIDCNDQCNPWALVTNVSELTLGSEIVIAAKDYDFALSTNQTPNNRSAVSITRNGNTVSLGNDVQIITLENGTENNTFAFNVGNGAGNAYLYAAGANSNNYLRTQTGNNNANGSWEIAIANDGAATIKAKNSYSRNWLRYNLNSGAPIFSCYASGQQDVVIYKRHSLTTQSDTTVTACSSYYWNGTVYDQSGDYSVTLTNAASCDSIATLHLTIIDEDAATVVFNAGNGTCDVRELSEADCQTGIILPTAVSCAPGYIFAGWSTQSINTSITTAPNPLYAAGSLYNPITDQTLYAVYKKCNSSEQAFLKVTSDTNNWTGDYLIVYEDGNLAFNGGLTVLDAVNNTIPVTISNNIIAYNQTTNDAKFTIASLNNSWTIKSASNYYIGQTHNANGLESNQTTQYSNSINFSNDSINIISSGGAYLRFNDNSDQERFRFYKSGTYTIQKAIQLFKYELIEECEYTTFPFFPSESENDTACSSFTWTNGDGQTYTESGTYYHAYDDANGCHHVDTLYLTIKHNKTGDTTATACDSFDWYEHTGITSSTNSLTHTFTNTSGCDSVVTLHLTINHSKTGDTTATACDSFDWYEHTGITSSTNSLTHTFTNTSGCDSVVTLHLTINHSKTGDTTATACDSFDWYEHTGITSSTNSLTHTFTSTSGCDSVVTLHLTINHTPVVTISGATAVVTGNSTTLTAAEANSYQWSTGDTSAAITETPSATTTYTVVGTTDGCSSDPVSVTVIVSECEPRIGDTTAVACDIFTWYGTDYTSSTEIATHVFEGVMPDGCDSIVRLHLTINQKVTEIVEATACDSFVWHGRTFYGSTDTATFRTTSALGCDSVVTLHLTINHSNTGDTTAVACDSFDWYEHTNITASCDNLTHTFTNANGCDSVVTLHLTINHSVTEHVEATACDSFEWHGRTFYESTDTATFRTTCALGCDSIVTLHLMVNHSATGDTTVVACNRFTWHGVEYTETPTVAPTHTYRTEHGCDSVVTLHLTINHSVAEHVEATACDSFEWHGRTFYESTDTATFRTTCALGCDSIVTLHLTVNHSNIGDTTVVACNRFTWHGVEYTETPTVAPTHTYRTEHGCDSVVTLHLTINHSVAEHVEATACDSFVWHGRTFYESTDTATFRTTNAVGCDSIVTLHLTVNTSSIGDTTATSCGSFVWHGRTFTESTDTATFRTTNAVGCDSIVTLHLTVNTPTTGDTTATSCGSFVWHGRTFTESTDTATFRTTNAVGCDSIVTLHLIVNTPTTRDTAATACDSFVWHGRTFYESTDTATFRTTNAAGCDSIVILHLTVNPTLETVVYDEVNEGEEYIGNGFVVPASETVNVPDYHLSLQNTLVSVSGCDSIVTLELDIIEPSQPEPPQPVPPQPEPTQPELLLSEMYLPNAITPSNHDGLNDFFSLPETYIDRIGECEIMIFNRWGETVFYSNDKHFRWYGDYKGTICKEQVFSYKIKIFDIDGIIYRKKGSILVL